MPGRSKRWWKFNHFGDLSTGESAIEIAKRLIIQVRIEITLFGEVVDDVVGSPCWPMMRGKRNITAGSEHRNAFVEKTCPRMCVAYECTTQRHDVVQVVRCILGHAEGSKIGEVKVHLGRSFGARSHLEHDAHTIEHKFLSGVSDIDRWWQQ